MVNIHNLIAAISPDVFCDESVKSEVKKIVKSEGYQKAAEKSKPIESRDLFNYDAAKNDALKKWGLKSPIEKHKLSYDSPADGLEPVYFWILDFASGAFKEVEKLSDTFASSVGSGHFSELGQRMTLMQQQSTKLLGDVNTVLKSILGILYDLKEFKLKLRPYDSLTSKEEKEKTAATLSLKQTWMDTVDMKRGQGSINALTAGQLDFATLRDAFMKAESEDQINKMDLNDRVKRILIQRYFEFKTWRKESELSLRQRFAIEKNYLKSQVNSLKLYSKWMVPYLKAANQLSQKEMSNASLVNVFNTLMLELTLLAKDKYDPKDDVTTGVLPKMFEKISARKYSPLIIIEFKFRGIPRRVSQRGDWAFGGKTDVEFTSYALNEQELKVLKDEFQKDDFSEMLKLIQGGTDDSIKEMQKDIDEFTDAKKEEKKEEKKDIDDTNPFSALFSFMKPKKKEEKKKEDEDLSRGIKPDNDYEKVIRSQAIITAREKCFSIFDTYKKAHGMPSHASHYDPIL